MYAHENDGKLPDSLSELKTPPALPNPFSNEPFEYALRRFKRSCEKAGVLSETRRREYYEKPTQERKRKKAAAVKRHMRRVAREVNRRQRLY